MTRNVEIYLGDKLVGVSAPFSVDWPRPVPATLRINGATGLVWWRADIVGGFYECGVLVNGGAINVSLPDDFGPGSVVNINSQVIEWDS